MNKRSKKQQNNSKLVKGLVFILFIISGAGLLFSAYGFFSSIIQEISVNESISRSYIYLVLLITSLFAGLIVNKQYQIKIKRK